MIEEAMGELLTPKVAGSSLLIFPYVTYTERKTRNSISGNSYTA